MKINVLPSCASVAALSLTAFAAADVIPELATYAGGYIVDARTGLTTDDKGGSVNKAASIVYDNTSSSTSLAFSSTDLTMTWGDECTLSGTGILDSFKFSVFNSGNSAGTLTGATFRLTFTRLSDSAVLGSYDGSVTFTTALGKGFYSVITSTGLASNNINLSTTGPILVTQQVIAKTGSASRLGVVSLNPVTVGSSPNYFYESGATTTPGWYTSASGPVNLVYQIGVNAVPAPGAAALVGLAGIITGRRRR